MSYDVIVMGMLAVAFAAILSLYVYSCVLSLARKRWRALNVLVVLMVFPVLVSAVLLSDELLRSGFPGAYASRTARQYFILTWLAPVAITALIAIARVCRRVQTSNGRRAGALDSASEENNAESGRRFPWLNLAVLGVTSATIASWSLWSWGFSSERRIAALGAVLFVGACLVGLLLMWRLSVDGSPPKEVFAKSLIASGVCNVLLAGSSFTLLVLGNVVLGSVAGAIFLLCGFVLIVAGRKLAAGETGQSTPSGSLRP